MSRKRLPVVSEERYPKYNRSITSTLYLHRLSIIVPSLFFLLLSMIYAVFVGITDFIFNIAYYTSSFRISQHFKYRLLKILYYIIKADKKFNLRTFLIEIGLMVGKLFFLNHSANLLNIDIS